jgi:hypothetical protein
VFGSVSRTNAKCVGGLIWNIVQALVGFGFGSICDVSREGFVVLTSAVRAPSHQAEYVMLSIPMTESRLQSLIPV